MIYTETTIRSNRIERKEEIDVPKELVKLVNSADPVYGRNGYHYLGCNRKRQGGYTIDRLREYIDHHNIYCKQPGHSCNCPIILA